MKDVKINDYLWFQEGPGVRNTQYTTSGVKLINVANLVDGEVDLSTSNRYISEEEAYGKYNHFLANEGDFVIASSGIKIDYFEKKMGFVKKEHLPLCMNTSCIRFRVNNEDELNIKYFMYYLKSNSFKTQLFNQITGSAQLNFGPSHLKKMTFPLIEINKQNEIVKKLEKTQDLISSSKELLSKYDILIKSRFIEMFGDPVTNPMGWEVKKLGDYIQNANNGMARRGNDKDGAIVLRLVELQRGLIDYSESNRILLKENEKKRYELVENDILFARVNGNPDNVGRCAFFKNIGEPVYHNDHIIRVHFDEKNLNEYYLNVILNSKYGMSEFKKYIKTSAGQYTIAQDGIASAEIPVPSLELQQQFADFVQQIGKSKFEYGFEEVAA